MTSTSLATGCTRCWWLHWRTVKLRNMYLFCISCKWIVSTIKVPTLVVIIPSLVSGSVGIYSYSLSQTLLFPLLLLLLLLLLYIENCFGLNILFKYKNVFILNVYRPFTIKQRACKKIHKVRTLGLKSLQWEMHRGNTGRIISRRILIAFSLTEFHLNSYHGRNPTEFNRLAVL